MYCDLKGSENGLKRIAEILHILCELFRYEKAEKKFAAVLTISQTFWIAMVAWTKRAQGQILFV